MNVHAGDKGEYLDVPGAASAVSRFAMLQEREREKEREGGRERGRERGREGERGLLCWVVSERAPT